MEKEKEKAGNEFRYVETEIGKKSKSSGRRRNEPKTGNGAHVQRTKRDVWVCLTDNQDTARSWWMVAIIVVVAAVIRVGHYSRRMEAASRKKQRPTRRP